MTTRSQPASNLPADPTRRTALVAGLLYLLTFVSSIPAVLLLQPVLTSTSFITSAGPDRQVLLGASLDIVNALACIGTAVALFSVVKRQHEGLALGFMATRLFEAAVITTGVVSLLAVVSLRQPAATGAEATALTVVGQALVAVRGWTFILGPGLMPAFNALLLGTLLYRSRLVPRPIPILALVGAPLLLSSTVGTFFGINEPMSAWTGIATLPIFLWELSLGLWMTVKGFSRTSAIVVAARESAHGTIAPATVVRAATTAKAGAA